MNQTDIAQSNFSPPINQESEKILLSSSNNQISNSTTDTKISCFQLICFIAYILLITLLALLMLLVPSIKNVIYEFMVQVNAEMSITTIIYLFLLGFGLVIIGFPILIYELALGFMINDYFFALGIDIGFKFFGSLCLFIFSRYILKPKLEIFLKDSFIFKSMQRGVFKNPWKATILIKLLVIPHIFKNLGLGITSLLIYQFSIISFFSCAMFGTVWIYFGSQMKSLKDAFGGKIESESYVWIKYSLLTLTALIMCVLLIYAKIYFDEIKLEIRKEEKKDEEKDSLVNDDKPKNYGTLE